MRVGIEIEFTGVTVYTATKSLARHWGTTYESTSFMRSDGPKPIFVIPDKFGNIWRTMRDSSIRAAKIDGIQNLTEYACEITTPVLDTENKQDMDLLKEAMDHLRGIGGVVNDSCGIHIHVDMQDLAWVDKVFKKVFMHQNSIASTLHIPMYRMEKYCKLYPEWFTRLYVARSPFKSLEEWESFFYEFLTGGEDINDAHNPIRYYVVNMNSIHVRNTLEFRPFNSSLDYADMLDYIKMVDWFCAV